MRSGVLGIAGAVARFRGAGTARTRTSSATSGCRRDHDGGDTYRWGQQFRTGDGGRAPQYCRRHSPRRMNVTVVVAPGAAGGLTP